MAAYNQFGLETRTVLGSQDAATGVFLLAENRDLFWIVYDDPGPPAKTAVHVIVSVLVGFTLKTHTIDDDKDHDTGIFVEFLTTPDTGSATSKMLSVAMMIPCITIATT
jgi:hypothetical protein